MKAQIIKYKNPGVGKKQLFFPYPSPPGKNTKYISPGINQFTNLMMKNTVNKSLFLCLTQTTRRKYI